MSVSITAVDAAFATNTDNTIYTVPAGKLAIIDKMTAQNSDGSSQTININIIPNGGSVGSSNLIMNATSMSTLATRDFTELQNQILKAGDALSIKGSVASKIVVRVSLREVTT